MSDSQKGIPEKDPYEVLGIDFSATEAGIAKAYRKLALKYHPDKKQQQQASSSQEDEVLLKKFHDVQQARAFLLEPEHAQDLAAFKLQRASRMARQAADTAREALMSAQRKQFRDDLQRQEQEAQSQLNQRQTQRSKDASKVQLDELRRQGEKLRQDLAEQQAQKEILRQRQSVIEDRQITIKWSRKKMDTSPSEHSLAQQFAEYGTVEAVELLGSKGNAALITFASPHSCTSAVKAYANSDQMRAKYVGARKDREEQKENAANAEASSNLRNARDGENVMDWKLRQAAERERLIREMEAEEKGNDTMQGTRTPKKASKRPFPVAFPDTDEYKGLTPWQKLEKAEADILGALFDPEVLQKLRSSAI
jgi:DnaJ homolog subfamily C member 17